ncbi:MAG: serine hydrolase [Candidatus Latescibacteria bacterium]|nr:serine hydrolase [Candidatus Latescibacterota bacterium]NIO57302.1 serine hydrolase [Candidatus Latescibacterota bacterium]
MKRTIVLVTILAVVVGAVTAAGRSARGSNTTEARDDERLASRIERIENGLGPSIRIKDGPVWNIRDRMEQLNVPGLAVTVFDNYEIEWVKSYGVTDAASKAPVTDETLFQAASISKPIAAMIALHFVEKGVLDLDGDVNEKLRSWKVPENEFTRDEKVTIRRILSHTAGLTVSGFRGYAEGEPVPNILEVLDGKKPSNNDPIRVDVVPGSTFRYSGGGYTVLQLLIEDVTGKPLHELAQELVFEPLDMNHSSFQKPLPEALLAKTSSGHLRDGSPMRGHWFLDTGSTCCGLWTTPADLARFAIEIQRSLRGESNKILTAEAAGLMVTPQSPSPMGLGMSVQRQNGTVYFSHSGGNVGFRCRLVASTDGGKGAAVMTNSDNGGALMVELLQSIAFEYQWKDYMGREYESIDDALDAFRKLKKDSPDDPDVSEGNLNWVGYYMLQAQEYEIAIAVFQLNVEFHPTSANVYDSLAEAYMTSGNKEKAVEFYRKALATLDQYPEENERYQRLRESIPKQLEKLEQ